jgi:hypothetical protein
VPEFKKIRSHKGKIYFEFLKPEIVV